MVYASNRAGYSSQTLSITVAPAGSPSVPAPSGLTYPVGTIAATVGQAIATDTPSVTGNVTSWSVAPALPAGITLNTATGAIAGIPAATSSKAVYSVTAANSTGSAKASLTLGVSPAPVTSTPPPIAAPSGLGYPQSAIAATVGQAIATDTPTVTGTVTSWTVTPALPAGLSLSSTNGTISGTPSAAKASAAYTITAANSSGSTTGSVTISATAAPAAATLAYSPATIAGTAGTAITPDVPTLGNATASSYSISPALPAGLSLNASTGVISGTPTASTAAASYTVSAATGSGTVNATLTISVQAAPVAGSVPGFTGLFQYFPGTAKYASSNTAAAMAANPWMKGGRFWVGTEDVCQDTALPLADWNGDVANVSGFKSPLNTAMIRLTGDPDGSWNIQSASAVTDMDAVIAGVVAVATAANTTNFMFDPENYSTSKFFSDYNQTSPILNSPALSRSAMCAKMRSFGKALGTSLWSRMPNATFYTFFGPTFVLDFTNGGTGMPTSCPDSAYASDPYYNMLPYFFLGLLDACPSTGHIADYCERSYYDTSGLASIKRNMTASKNWVSIFFPTEAADIAKSATCWVPLPLIFANPYFDSSYGSIYPGATFVTNPTDQQNYFTRNAYYCLSQTPAGYLPGVYVENYDPWGAIVGLSNMPANWQKGLVNAMAVYNGTTTLDSLFNGTTLDNTLAQAFSGNSAWAAESK